MLAINYAAPQHSFMVILPVSPVPIVHTYSVREFIAGQGGWRAHYNALRDGRITFVTGLRYDPTATQLTYAFHDCLMRVHLALHPAVVLGAVQCGGMGVLKRLFDDREDRERAEADMRRLLGQLESVQAHC